MRVSWAKMALLTVLTASVVGPVSSAIAQQPSDMRVDYLRLEKADMLSATKVLTQRTGLQFIIEPSDTPFGKISLQLKDVSPEDAIRYVCQAAGATFRRDENGVYIISHSKPVVDTPIPTEAPRPAVTIVRRIKVLKAGVRDVYEAMRYGTPFDSARGFADLKRFTQAAMPSQNNFSPQINLLGNTPRESFSPSAVIGSQPNPQPLTGAESGGGVVIPGMEAAGQGGLAGGTGGGNQGRGGGGQGGIGGGGGQNGGGGNVSLQGGTGLVPADIDWISYDPTDNSLVVRGTEEAINTLQNYVNLFDVAPRQVLIKVEFITTTDTLDKSLGYEFLYQRGTIFAGTRPGAFIRSTDPVFLNYATGNITSRLRTALTQGGGKVVTAPIVRTLNNQPATVSNTIQTYVFTSQTSATGGSIINSTVAQQLTISTFLSVAPRINQDNTITMYLQPQVGSIVGFSRSPDGSDFPNIATQGVSVVARVANNETIVLGGLNTKSEDTTTSRVPVLSELPIFGQFFKFSRTSHSTSELLIFVTPTILDDDTTGNPGGP